MKTLQIVGDSKYGGATYLIIRWCQFLLAQNCEVDVLTTDPTTIARLQEIPTVRILDFIHIPRDIAFWQDARAFGKLVSLLRQQKYEVVHTYTATPSFLGRFAARAVSIPVILHHQAGWTVTNYSSMLERILYTPLEYIATLAGTKSICVSHAVAQQAKKLHIAPQRRLITICNGIDPEPFINAVRSNLGVEVRRELGIPPDCLVLGNTGRLATQKDNATLIQSMVMLKGLIPDRPFLLLLAGEGPERSALEALTHELGLSNYVRFLGFYTNIPGLLAALDIFISPSLREGLSISVMEAMAAARPIVTTSILPNAELIEHEMTGLLVPPKQPELLARAIARFVSDPQLALHCGAAAQQRVLENYTIDRMFQETWGLYTSLLEEQKRKGKSVLW